MPEAQEVRERLVEAISIIDKVMAMEPFKAWVDTERLELLHSAYRTAWGYAWSKKNGNGQIAQSVGQSLSGPTSTASFSVTPSTATNTPVSTNSEMQSRPSDEGRDAVKLVASLLEQRALRLAAYRALSEALQKQYPKPRDILELDVQAARSVLAVQRWDENGGR